MPLKKRDKRLLKEGKKMSGRDNTMFQGGGSFGKPIDPGQVAVFSPLLGTMLDTDRQLQELTTNSLRFRKERGAE